MTEYIDVDVAKVGSNAWVATIELLRILKRAERYVILSLFAIADAKSIVSLGVIVLNTDRETVVINGILIVFSLSQGFADVKVKLGEGRRLIEFRRFLERNECLFPILICHCGFASFERFDQIRIQFAQILCLDQARLRKGQGGCEQCYSGQF